MGSIAPQVRSNMMRSIRKENTGPERAVRSLIRALGARGYRLHAKELPGRPDIVFRRRKLAIFVHGCFWHQHGGCHLAKKPSARAEYWLPKLARNQERDLVALQALAAAGWDALVVWECELSNVTMLTAKLKRFLRIRRE
ncbi:MULTISPECIES: very short patch repair endonuclease [unclassified Bradyrhizobium]|uniref:very short patch repair endonuclease n=1 Tax=unclassified Bradyrhizobium TaxID=2631580 RepID=UPI002916E2A5|nr:MULTISPECIES: very short patch repair endonuclease [unclassified Bradyrhizobium]